MEERLDRLGEPPPTRVSGPRPRPKLPRDPSVLPELPAAYHRALDAALRGVGVALPPPAREAIESHVRLLLAWNAAINLTAITEPEAMAVRHVADSLTALPLLGESRTILDLGSGGGFPGLPLAAALPAARVTLLDAVAKKAAFLEVAVAGAGLAGRVTVRAARAEALSRTPAWDAVLARGVGTLADLIELAMSLLARGGRLIAWKRGDLTAELEAGRRAAAALGAGEPRVTPATPRGPVAGLEGHVLVEVRKVGPTPRGYPRDPGIRRRRPW